MKGNEKMKIDKDKPTFYLLRDMSDEKIERLIPMHAVQEIEIESRRNEGWQIVFFIERPRCILSDNIYARAEDRTIEVGRFESYEEAKEFLQKYIQIVDFDAPRIFIREN